MMTSADQIALQLVAHSVATYARSFDGFPERTETAANALFDETPTKYHGPYLVR